MVDGSIVEEAGAHSVNMWPGLLWEQVRFIFTSSHLRHFQPVMMWSGGGLGIVCPPNVHCTDWIFLLTLSTDTSVQPRCQWFWKGLWPPAAAGHWQWRVSSKRRKLLAVKPRIVTQQKGQVLHRAAASTELSLSLRRGARRAAQSVGRWVIIKKKMKILDPLWSLLFPKLLLTFMSRLSFKVAPNQ